MILCHVSINRAFYYCTLCIYNRNPTIFRGAHFGPGTDFIHMKDVRCTGSETDIAQCRFTGWTIQDCSHTEDVGIDCGNILFIIRKYDDNT